MFGLAGLTKKLSIVQRYMYGSARLSKVDLEVHVPQCYACYKYRLLPRLIAPLIDGLSLIFRAKQNVFYTASYFLDNTIDDWSKWRKWANGGYCYALARVSLQLKLRL